MPAVNLKVEIEFTPGSWTDVSSFVDASSPITMTAGRTDVESRVPPGSLTGLVLDNTDGRFTVGNPSGAYWPNVTSGKRIRVGIWNPVGAVYTTRFVGRIDGWPMSWAGNSCWSTPTATDELNDWAVVDMPVDWMYRRTLELGGSSLLDYWECSVLTDDGKIPNSHRAGALVNNGAGPTTLSGQGFPGDPRPTPEHVYGSGLYVGSVATQSSNSWALTGWVRITGAPPSTGFYPVIVEREVSVPPGDRVAIRVKADSVYLSTISAGNIVTDRITVGVDITDGSWHSFRLSITESGGVATGALYVDNIGSATTTGFTLDNTLANSTYRRSLKVGTSTTGSVAHLGYWSPSCPLTNQQIAEVGAGISGSGAGARIAQIANMAGLPAPTLSGTLRAGIAPSTPLGKALDLVAVVEDTEGGLFWCDAGTMTFNAGSKRTDAPTVALSITASSIDPSLTVVADRATVANSVTITNTVPVSSFRPDPTITTTVVEDAASIAAMGKRPKTLETIWRSTTDPGYLNTLASELMNPVEAPRIPALVLDALTLPSATQNAILSANVWDLIAVTALPSAGGMPSAWLGRIEGWREVVSVGVWSVEYTMSFAGARVGDSTFGVVGTLRLG